MILLELVREVDTFTVGRRYYAQEEIEGYFLKNDFGDWCIVNKCAFKVIEENVYVSSKIKKNVAISA